MRPTAETPVPVPPDDSGLPDRDALAIAPFRPTCDGRRVGDRRARVREPSEGRVFEADEAQGAFVCRLRAALNPYADDVPLLGDHGTSCVVGAPARGRGDFHERDRPTEVAVLPVPREGNALSGDQMPSTVCEG